MKEYVEVWNERKASSPFHWIGSLQSRLAPAVSQGLQCIPCLLVTKGQRGFHPVLPQVTIEVKEDLTLEVRPTRILD